MNFLIKIVFTSIFVFSFFSINAQVKKTFSGILLNSTDSTPVANAHVINYKAKKVTSTDITGHFDISIRKNDNIVISKIGYQPLELIESNITEVIYLKKKSYQLDQFIVNPYSNYQEFKEAFIKKVIIDNKPKINSSIYLTPEDRKKYGARGGIGISYKTHRMKDRQKLEAFLAKERYRDFLATKYNPEMVKRITKLENPTELKDFITFCAFSDNYVASSSLYDIITKIYERYDEYNNLKKKK